MPKKKPAAFHIIVIVLVTAAAFYPTLKNGFTNFDDPELLLNNDNIKTLSLSQLGRLLTTSGGGFGGYGPFPVVFLSYALEYHFFQFNPLVYHVDNLVLH